MCPKSIIKHLTQLTLSPNKSCFSFRLTASLLLLLLFLFLYVSFLFLLASLLLFSHCVSKVSSVILLKTWLLASAPALRELSAGCRVENKLLLNLKLLTKNTPDCFLGTVYSESLFQLEKYSVEITTTEMFLEEVICISYNHWAKKKKTPVCLHANRCTFPQLTTQTSSICCW